MVVLIQHLDFINDSIKEVFKTINRDRPERNNKTSIMIDNNTYVKGPIIKCILSRTETSRKYLHDVHFLNVTERSVKDYII